jgi:predicted secreted Zn-dependent protease
MFTAMDAIRKNVMSISLTRSAGMLCVIAAVAAIASPAAAISRVSSTSRTCGELRQIINQQGAVIVTHPGTAQSGILYDRYVSDSDKCDSGNVATDDWVPAKDRNCRLSICQPYEPPFGDD